MRRPVKNVPVKYVPVKFSAAIAFFAAVLVAATSCSPTPEAAESNTLKIVYQKTDSFTALDAVMQDAKKEFEAANSGVTVDLQPIQANDDDYGTKLSLAQRSADTAPDVFYEDTFKVRSDVDAGYLLRLDSYLEKWEDWSAFNEAAKAAGRADDGGIYAVPLGTDTRAIWYNKAVFQKAGVPVPWQPKTWDDILTTARAIKASDPSVIPFNMYAGKGTGEGTVMQSFYELLYGTDSTLYDEKEKKWVVGSLGFTDSLAFLKTLYDEKLAVSPAEALDANVWKKVFGEWFPQGKLAATVEGSYTPSFWQKGGAYEWAGYEQDMAVAMFPTQKGQAPGGVSMSGGWTLAVGAKSKNPELAFQFLTTALNKKNALAYDINNSQIAVRTDVASEPQYLAANPFVKDVSDLVKVTHYRPATADYPRISSAVQVATESVITGKQSPEDAAAEYDATVRKLVGEDKVLEK
ncbi:extracellular solute-binding protein [Arthrobacter sp. Rue61a]|jgi:multiple sugar transport system substrate-binding protein|uniref:Extracellular solute-binding domain protein n=1 Tax=Paenarthrobacter aurescens (strain TC1) TaxID=290340 RepID=A1R777_PAEAT|nr:MULTISPECIES: extracellular solute-binding protein [Micrococcaceae]ABM06270.1 extracellular solute-binding domain protein [Paenarthrobacter aurescens TC1]AFR29408.1 extracellular solute-binding domain protein [Arthrobacter sp. Rue61a]